MALLDRATPHVVIVGAGFGGLETARKLTSAPVRVTLIDRENYHLFQPLLYQVAIAGLIPSQIAYPVRTIFRAQKNVTFQMGEVTAVDLDARDATEDLVAGSCWGADRATSSTAASGRACDAA